MDEAVRNPLVAWESFYIIMGSSAGALTGLQFVVMALIADSRIRATPPEIAAFGTPTILHFCAALLVSALLSVPWPSLSSAGLGLAACGVAGVGYAVVVVRRARRQQRYRPVLEDWVWHAVLPFLAYAVLLVAAVLLPRYSGPALSLVATVVLGLVFIGIHNAWDTIAYISRRPPALAGGDGEPRTIAPPLRRPAAHVPPNKRLKLTGGDRSKRSGVLCGGARTAVQRQMRRRASRRSLRAVR